MGGEDYNEQCEHRKPVRASVVKWCQRGVGTTRSSTDAAERSPAAEVDAAERSPAAEVD